MIYQLSQSFSKNGSVSNIESFPISLGRGIVYKIEIDFPPGSSGLLRVKISENDRQIYPTNNNEFFRGDNQIISFDDIYVVKIAPYEWFLEGYNLDTLYDHMVIVRIGFVSDIDIMRNYLPESLEKALSKMEDIRAENEEKGRENVRKSIDDIIIGKVYHNDI